jgi:asparagine synthetase B (glutamine-hydrolysing)
MSDVPIGVLSGGLDSSLTPQLQRDYYGARENYIHFLSV